MKGSKFIAVLLLFGLLSLVLQGVLRLLLVNVPYFCPQFILMIVVFAAFHEATIRGLIISFFLGLLLDMSSGLIIGPWAGAYVVVYTMIALVSQGVFLDAALTIVVGTFVGSLIASGTHSILSLSASGDAGTSVLGMLIEAVVTAFCAPILFVALRRVLRYFRIYRQRVGIRGYS